MTDRCKPVYPPTFSKRGYNDGAIDLMKQDYHGSTSGFLLLRNFSVAISVSPHVCFISD